MARFDGRVVMVTGGARGMGESHARAFIEEGAQVLIADVLEDLGRALASELGDACDYVALDVTREDEWSAAVRQAETRFGAISVLVNNAGVGPSYVALADHDVDAWRRIVEINLYGAFLGIRAVVPSMRRAGGGSIVNISSVSGYVGGGPGTTAYTASKWGLRGLTKTASLELGPDSIRVNAILPGAITTPMTSPRATATAAIPIPRPGRPAEVTRVALFLASDEASYCTGTDVVVDGGMTAGLHAPPGT